MVINHLLTGMILQVLGGNGVSWEKSSQEFSFEILYRSKKRKLDCRHVVAAGCFCFSRRV